MKPAIASLKINLPVRFKNPYFWVTLVATILATLGVSADMFTSWSLVWQAIVDLVSNPFQLGCVVVAIIGVFNDPTTSGIRDSSRALTYRKPNKE